jgi:hypothetical protein
MQHFPEALSASGVIEDFLRKVNDLGMGGVWSDFVHVFSLRADLDGSAGGNRSPKYAAMNPSLTSGHSRLAPLGDATEVGSINPYKKRPNDAVASKGSLDRPLDLETATAGM